MPRVTEKPHRLHLRKVRHKYDHATRGVIIIAGNVQQEYYVKGFNEAAHAHIDPPISLTVVRGPYGSTYMNEEQLLIRWELVR